MEKVCRPEEDNQEKVFEKVSHKVGTLATLPGQFPSLQLEHLPKSHAPAIRWTQVVLSFRLRTEPLRPSWQKHFLYYL